MKHTKYVLAIVCIVFSVGCEQNSTAITDVKPPIDGFSMSRSRDRNIILPLHVIVLNQVLREPRGNNALLEVRGNVHYSMTIVSVDPTEQDPHYAVSITLAVRAMLGSNDYATSPWTISTDSHNEMPLGDGGSVTFEKRYRVAGRTDGLVLIIRFRATVGALAEQHLEVVGIWLDLSNVEQAVDGN